MAQPSVPIVGDAFDLSVEEIRVDGKPVPENGEPVPEDRVFIFGEENVVTATIMNNGDVRVNATVNATAFDGSGRSVTSNFDEQVTLPAGQPVTVTFRNFGMDVSASDGTNFLPGDEVMVRVQVFVAPSDVVLDLTPGEKNPASENWDALWNEGTDGEEEQGLIALVKDTVAGVLFENGVEDFEGQQDDWDEAWDERVHPTREATEEQTMDEGYDRIDRNPSNNALDVGPVEVIEHRVEIAQVTAPVPADGETLDVESGEVVTAQYKITNAGDRDNRISIRLENTDEEAGWNFTFKELTFDPEDLTLEPGRSKIVKITMEGPRDAYVDEVGTANLTVTSMTAPLNGGATKLITSPPAKEYGDIFATIDPTHSGDTVPNTDTARSVEYHLTVTNRKNTNLTITPFAYIDPALAQWWDSGDMTFQATTPVSGVEQGEIAQFDVTLDIPWDAPAGNHDFGIEVDWRAESGSSDDLLVPQNYTLHVPQWYRVKFADSSTLPTQIEPGTPVSLPFHIYNEGNGPDSFNISMVEAPNGWRLVDANGDSTQPFSVPRDTTITDLGDQHFIKIPADALPGPESMTFSVVSENDTAASHQMAHPVMVPERVFPEIIFGGCPTVACTIDENDTIEINVTVSNLGNVKGVIDLGTEVEELGENTGWTVAIDPQEQEVELERGETKQVTLTVKSPDAPDSHSLHPSDRAVITITGAAERSHKNNEDSDAIIIFAGAPNLVVGDTVAVPDGFEPEEVRADPRPLYLNLPGELVVNVTNTGTAATDEFDVEVNFTAAGTVIATETTTVLTSIAAGATEPISVPIPTDQGEDKLLVTIRLDAGNVVAEYDEGDNEQQEDLSLRVFEFTIEPPEDMEVDPGQALSLECTLGFLVANARDDTETIDIQLSADPSWTQGSWHDQNIEPGGSETESGPCDGYYGTNFFIPERPEILDAQLTLRVRHVDHPSLFFENGFTIHVNDTAPPEISATPPTDDEVTRGSSINITAQIWDLSGVDVAKVVLEPPTGGIEHITMNAGTGTTHYAVVPLTTPGTYKWHIWAKDDSDGNLENDTSDAPFSVVVKPESQPGLKLVTPTGGGGGSGTGSGTGTSSIPVIRPGDDFVVSAFNTTGLQSANATVVHGAFEQTFEVSSVNPIIITTDLWPDGIVQVTVRIIDSYGSRAQETFNVQVDGTPPTIGDADFVHDIVNESVNVTVNVTDNLGVVEVKLRIDPGDGKGAEDVSMVEEGGTYTAQTKQLANGASLTVIAQDVAGNSVSKRIADGATFDGEDVETRPTPGAGFAASLLMVLALAKFVTRRRQDGSGGSGL